MRHNIDPNKKRPAWHEAYQPIVIPNGLTAIHLNGIVSVDYCPTNGEWVEKRNGMVIFHTARPGAFIDDYYVFEETEFDSIKYAWRVRFNYPEKWFQYFADQAHDAREYFLSWWELIEKISSYD